MTYVRVEGMLIGLAVGDALGAPVEFGWNSQSISDRWSGNMEDHRLPAGYYTDDTAMALCLADSLLERGGYDSWDVMERYRRWMFDGYRDAENKAAPDVGIQTSYAISRFIQNPVIDTEDERTTRAGNGGIMRLAPVVLATANASPQTTIELARISSRETHYSAEAEAAAEVFGALLRQALHEDSKPEVFDVGKWNTGAMYDDVLARVMEARDYDSRHLLRDRGGYVVDALWAAIWGFANFDSFEEGLLEVIRLGGDTDTNGAIYGQFAGAHYGFGAIPDRWLAELYLQDELRDIARRLHDKQPGAILATRFREDATWFQSEPSQ